MHVWDLPPSSLRVLPPHGKKPLDHTAVDCQSNPQSPMKMVLMNFISANAGVRIGRDRQIWVIKVVDIRMYPSQIDDFERYMHCIAFFVLIAIIFNLIEWVLREAVNDVGIILVLKRPEIV